MKNFILQLFEKPAFTAILGAIISQTFSLILFLSNRKHENKIFIMDRLINNIFTAYANLEKELFKLRPVFIELQRLPIEDRDLYFREKTLDFAFYVCKDEMFFNADVKKHVDDLINYIDLIEKRNKYDDKQIDEYSDIYHTFISVILLTIKDACKIEYIHKLIKKSF